MARVVRLAAATVLGVCGVAVSVAAPELIPPETATCCGAAYYCVDPQLRGAGCQSDSEQPFADPYACNEVSRRCEIPGQHTPGCCAGDCDGNGLVAVSELVRAVNAALGLSSAVRNCICADRNRDGTVDVRELVSAVNNALVGCAALSPPRCGGGMPLPTGPLCGSAARPCRILADDRVAISDSTSFDELTVVAVVVGQDGRLRVLAATDTGEGRFATDLGDGSYRVEAVPFTGPATLFVRSDGTLLTIADYGRVWMQAGGEWIRWSGRDGVGSDAWSLRIDASDCIYGLTVGDFGGGTAISRVLYTPDGDFRQVLDLPNPSARYGTVTISPEGRFHAAYWSTDQTGWVMRLASPPASPITVHSLGNSALDTFAPPLAVGPEGQVHLLVPRTIGTQYAYGKKLTYITGSRSAGWQQLEIARGTLNEYVFERCGPPPSIGRTCTYSYQTVSPADIAVNADGEVRLFYLRTTIAADLIAVCPEGSPYWGCRWEGHSSVNGDLMLAAPDIEAVNSSVVAHDVRGAAVTVDRIGHMHVLTSDGEATHHIVLGE